jgi:hypothetical protein
VIDGIGIFDLLSRKRKINITWCESVEQEISKNTDLCNWDNLLIIGLKTNLKKLGAKT